MNRLIWLLLIALPCNFTQAEDWYTGLGLGYFELKRDRANSDEPKSVLLGSSTGNIFVGYEFNQYLELKIDFDLIDRTTETDIDNFESEFSGYALSPSIITKYPIGGDNKFDLYARFGASFFDYEMANLSLGEKVDETSVQPLIGIGFQGKYIFAEYTNYFELNDMTMQQLRIGFRLEF